MEPKKQQHGWTLRLLSVVFLLAGLTACSGGSDEENKEGGSGSGGVKPDPNIPELSEIKYELNPTATFVPEAVIKQITGVDTLGHRLTLPASADKPEVGQTLILNIPTKDLPDGLLAKVKSVSESSNGYIVTYEKAELKDAFKDIDVPEQYIALGEYVQHIYDADGNEVKFQRVARKRASGQKDFLIEIPQISWKIADGVELTPKMSIDMLLRYVMQFGDYELSYAAVKVDADVMIGADLNVNIDEKTFGEKRWRIISQIVFGNILVPAPPALPVITLKPAFAIDLVLKADGKITLEASISYERTVHSSVIYQKGAGVTGDFKLDPEAADALKYSFGPKFEGGIGFGPSLLVWLGVYGEAMCLRSTLDMLTKATVSGKLDLISLTKKSSELLLPITSDPASHPNWDKTIQESFKTAKKWDFLSTFDLAINLSFVESLDFKLITFGRAVMTRKLPEVSVPYLSTPVMPQLKIDDKDCFDIKDNNVTLMIHHTKKSLLDNLTKFRAEFTPVDADGKSNSKNTIVKDFDFDDEKRNLLVAEIKGSDVKSTATTTIDRGTDYNVVVYMNVAKIDLPIFTMKLMKEEQETSAKIYPDKVEFDAMGGSNNEVKITKGNYKNCGVDDVPAPDNKWLSAQCTQDGAVTIEAKPNMSFEGRKGEVKCWVSNKENPQPGDKKYLTVEVIQNGVTGVDWNPKELKFTASGGSEKISFKFGEFTRFGAQVRKEGQGWCGVAAANGKLTITVQPNETKEPRECIVDAYVTNSQNPTDEDKLLMPITVYQEGAKETKPSSLKIKSVVLSAEYNDGSKRSFTVDWNKKEGTIQAEIINGSTHVTCTNNTGYNKSTLSFDIDSESLLSSKKATISNFKSEGKEYSMGKIANEWNLATKSKSDYDYYTNSFGEKICALYWKQSEFTGFEHSQPNNTITLSDSKLSDLNATVTIKFE